MIGTKHISAFARRTRRVAGAAGRAGLGLTLALGLLSPALGQAGPVPAAAPAPWQQPPFSAAAFWSKLDRLLSEHDGYVTRARLERELGVPMAHATEVAPGYMQYLLERDTDWYMTVALVEYGAHSFVDFKWYPENFPGPAPQCVDVDTARQRILQLGWTLGFSDRHISVFDQFSKNGNSLHLYFGGKCVHALRFGGVNRDPAS